ncbi:ADP-ribosylation factor-like protein 13A [Sceloporus undulatus]|uniref:ADP-ribosylation factor-like protein 13A n=1 Tax=Sceloporus undulatus TaxID=8520 RepID=UPI001C4B8F72|nr:ADP-ribosylation factor-like protein 13A [Sceloporus undulatus]
MFHLLSYCWSWLQAIQEPVRKVTILVLGLDGAGKSSIVKEIQRVLSCEVLPTSKPNQTDLRVDRFEVSLVDLAGGQRSWGTWKDHYSSAHGIIFVLDSGDVARMEEAKKTLSRLLGHAKVSGKPLLLLANKQDKVDALLPCEIIECLSLEKLANENKSLCRIEPCSATKKLPKIQCWTIVQGLHWLLQTIAINYGVLCGRIQEDSPQRKASADQEVSRKAQKSRSRTQEARESRSRKDSKQGGNSKMEENKSTEPIQDACSQGTQKEERATALKKRKGKVKQKVKKKNSVQSENTIAEDDSGKAAAGQRTKKKHKMLKNKIKSEETSPAQPNENLSSTFDLYRRAMLALKMQQGSQKSPSAANP